MRWPLLRAGSLGSRSGWAPGMIGFGCVLNLLPFTLAEGTRRHPGVAMRTDGGVILDLVRLIASLRTSSGT